MQHKKEVLQKYLVLTVSDETFEESINDIDSQTRTSGNYKEGLVRLSQIRDRNEVVERYIDDYVEKMSAGDYQFVEETLDKPRTSKQAMYLLGAARKLRDKGLLSKLRQMDSIKSCDDPMVRVLRDE